MNLRVQLLHLTLKCIKNRLKIRVIPKEEEDEEEIENGDEDDDKTGD